MDSKQCIACEKVLHLSLFDIDKGKGGKTRTRNKCSSCRLEMKHKQLELKKAYLEKNRVAVDKKVCTTCQKEQSINAFNKKALSIDGYNEHCKKCVSELRKKRKGEQKLITITDTHKVCKICNKSKLISLFKSAARSKDGLFKTCNDCWKPREWNVDKQRQSYKKYRKNNPDKIHEKENRPNYRLRKLLAKRIRMALFTQKTNKQNSTASYIGCDITFLRKWIEFQFTDEINWSNTSEWHIDHVKPCASFDLLDESQQKLCFSWKNLRPCLAEENMKKSAKIDLDVIKSHAELVEKFLDINPLPTQPGDRVEGAE